MIWWGLFAMGGGVILFLIVIGFVKYEVRIPASPPPESKGKTYGHPQPPVQALYDQLPTPPASMAWEIKVVRDGYPPDEHINDTSLWMVCNLISLTDGTVIDTCRVDLLWEIRYPYIDIDTCHSWREQYRKCPSRVNSMFSNKVIFPFIGWANAITDKYFIDNLQPGNAEYKIKGG